MVGNVIGALSLAMIALVTGQMSIIGGRARTLLSEKDVQQITRLASASHRTPWLLDVDRSMVLPEEWFVDAYLTADSETASLRRGRVTKLVSRVVGNIAQLHGPRHRRQLCRRRPDTHADREPVTSPACAWMPPTVGRARTLS